MQRAKSGFSRHTPSDIIKKSAGSKSLSYATGFTDENPAGIESSRFFLKPYSIAAVIQKTWSLLATP
jgi:hypothetical protein